MYCIYCFYNYSGITFGIIIENVPNRNLVIKYSHTATRQLYCSNIILLVILYYHTQYVEETEISTHFKIILLLIQQSW